MNNNNDAAERKGERGRKSQSFVKIPFTLLSRLHELAGPKLSIWTAYRLQEDKVTHAAWCPMNLLTARTGFSDEDKLREHRNEMVEAGWLIPAGEHKPENADGSKKGGSPIPKFRTSIPPISPGKAVEQSLPKAGGAVPAESGGCSTGEERGVQSPPKAVPAESGDELDNSYQLKEEAISLAEQLILWMRDRFSEHSSNLFPSDEKDVEVAEQLLQQYGEQQIRNRFLDCLSRDLFVGHPRPLSFFLDTFERLIPPDQEADRIEF